MAKWLLVRHGETEWNSESRIQGRTPTSLSPVGARQAELLAVRLKHTDLSAIYSSDLPRARETADIIAAGRHVHVQLASALQERYFGRWEGRTYQEIQATDPEGYAQWRQGSEQFCPPGGERVSDVLARVSHLAAQLIEAYPAEGNLLLVGHGGSLLTLTVSILGLPMPARQRFALANASLSVISAHPGSATLELWNDVSHLGRLG